MSAEKIKELEVKQEFMQGMVMDLISTSKETNESINKLTHSLTENSIEQRHTREQLKRTHTKLDSIDARTTALEMASAEDRPWVSLIKAMNTKVWMTLIGVILTALTSVGGMSYLLSTGVIK